MKTIILKMGEQNLSLPYPIKAMMERKEALRFEIAAIDEDTLEIRINIKADFTKDGFNLKHSELTVVKRVIIGDVKLEVREM